MERPGSATREMPVLTRREQDVLAALCAPLAADRPVAMPASIRDIAAELVVTEAAVKQHLLNLYDKFEIAEGTESRRIALAREAVLRGFLPGVGATPAGRTSRLDAGRAAARDRAWDDAYAALSEAAGSTPLDVADLELLGDAATWTGRFDASTTAREQAYAAYLSLGDRRSAARVALGLGWNAAVTLRFSVVAGWMASAGRLLAAEAHGDTVEAPVWPEHGLMLSLMALNELGTGQLEPGLEHARAAFDIGRRTGDPDIQALGLVFQGFGLVHQGRLDEGRALLDEAMASATAGHLGTLAQGMVYCRTLSACLDTFDYRRAIEWTEVIERRAPALGTVGFPGDCRTHRAAVLVDARRLGTRRRGGGGGRRRVPGLRPRPHGPGADRARRHPAATRGPCCGARRLRSGGRVRTAAGSGTRAGAPRRRRRRRRAASPSPTRSGASGPAR